MVKGVQS